MVDWGDVTDRSARLVGKVDPRLGNSYDEVINAWANKSDPAAGTVIVNTGNLLAGLYEITWAISSENAHWSYSLQWRDSSDAIRAQRDIGLPANGNAGGLVYIDASANDDVVIKVVEAYTGQVSGGLSVRRLVTS